MTRYCVATALSLAVLAAGVASADEAATFFDGTQVREIRITFTDANWYNTLYQAHQSNVDDPYFPARFECGGTVLETIGVRFKGNSSFRVNGVKKSFKLDFNEYVDDATFMGLKKLNLNNLALSPDFMREKLYLDFAGRFIPAMRAVHARVYVNGELWGLYMAVEQPDKTMMQSRFGDDEDGNLYEAGESNANLTYLGTDPASYTSLYELKTNETTNDTSDLIEFLDVLNNTATSELPAHLEPICDVENMLWGLALDNLFANVDSYIGSASEFYLYDRSDTGQFVRIHWDLNESFGTTGDGSPSVSNPMALSPFWLPSSSGGGPGGMGGPRPLASKLWAVDSYNQTYLRMLARMLREGFDTTTMAARISQLAGLIRADVSADPHKLYTLTQFETALNSQVGGGQTPIYGLNQFVSARYAYLRPLLNSYALPSDVRLNEVMPSGTSATKDEAGDADPWLELHNLGPGTMSLAGLYLTDDQATPRKWAMPTQTLADGTFLVVWMDGEPAEGTNHASFGLPSSGTVYLYSGATGTPTLLDSVTYPALAAGRSYIRLGSSGVTWEATSTPTAGTTNVVTGTTPAAGSADLRINELMADNDSTIADPDEAGAYEDWIEIFNPGTAAVDMGGMYLTDDLSKPTKWQVPRGVTIAAGGYLVFWADDEASQGSLHAAFKLSADGEAVGLFQPDGTTQVDSVTFGAQATDVSYGRYPDGSGSWVLQGPATPGAANRVSTWVPVDAAWVPVASHASGSNSSLWRTDLGVLNSGSAEATVELSFQASDGTRTTTTKVASGSQAILEDVVQQLGGSGSAALRVRSDQPVLVTSRTYNLVSDTATCSAGGTLGQDYPSYEPGSGLAAGQSAWLPQLTENARYRTNITLDNTGTAAATVLVTLRDGAGGEVGSYTVDLQPGEWKQENRPFATRAGQSSLTRGYAKVTVTAGSGVVAHASVVDNLTNDPTTVVMSRTGQSASGSAASGTGVAALRINELMADNDSTIADPDEAGAYEDWIEIYNPTAAAVDMSGLYLTDDLSKPTKWQVPQGVTIAAGGYLVFWADDEASQGSLHAAFKLSASGEAVGLFQADGSTVIDSVTFGAQATDVSYGRYPDGADTWATLGPATPGAVNRVSSAPPVTWVWVPVASHGAGANASQWRTDLGVLNPGSAAATVNVRFHASDGVKSTTVPVPAGSQSILVDVVDQLGGTGSAALEVQADQSVIVTSRTYSEISGTASCFPGGTLGQDYPSTASADGLGAGESAWLPQLVETTRARSNIALTNTGTTAASVAVTLFDGSGVEVGAYAVELGVGEWQQDNRPYATRFGRTDLARGYARVTVTTGSGVLAFASVVDNITNDPTTVQAMQ